MLNNNIRIDLHIHSKCSEYKEEKNYVDESNIDNVDELLKKLQENNINMFSITDHNKFDYELYKKFKTLVNAPPYENVYNILPGVEFDVKLEEESLVSCHIICIFDDCDTNKLEEIQNKIIEVRELKNKNDFYTLEEFENILKKIELNVILIAHQKSGFDVKSGKKTHHSLSEAVSNPLEWLKVGYINALEYQKPKVQGVLKNDLNDFKLKFSTITGSDCHVWKAYPKKDFSVQVEDNYVTKIKALPTFKGLVLALTSPETRFERKDIGENVSYLNSIKIGEKEYYLSTGINAIIGENGSGKSFLLGLLNAENEHKYEILKKINNIQISKVGDPVIIKINQGEIIEKVKKGTLLDDKSEYYDGITTLEEFKINIKTYVENLKKYILDNIKKNEEENRFARISIPIKEISRNINYYISLIVDVETEDNIPLKRYAEIETLYKLLAKEYDQNLEFYSGLKKVKIESVLNTLQELKTIISKESERVIINNNIINIVISVFDSQNNKIKTERTSQENEKEEYMQQIRAFANYIKYYISNSKKENIFPVFPNKLNGISVKSKSGFKFIKEAKFHQLDLEEPLYKELFVQQYQDKEKIKQINTKDDFAKAVNGITKYEGIENQIDANVNKFLKEYIKEETRIRTENGTSEIGTTPGEIALTFYQLLLSKDIESNIILIDQPEDDISMKRIESYMIDYFNSVRDKKQIIFVTHNPLLVVNLDVDNVINISKDRKNVLKIESGCLESGNMIELVSKNLDGGREAIERRLKIYGES